jgi:hypothetical protein
MQSISGLSATEDLLVAIYARTTHQLSIGGAGVCDPQSQSGCAPNPLTSRPIMLASVQHPSGLKLSAANHYKLTHPPQELTHSFFHFNTHLLERSLHLLLCSSICFLLGYPTMKFSRILVLYLCAVAAPSVLAIPLRHVDRCSLESTDARCIGQKDDHVHTSNSHLSGVNLPCELQHRHTPMRLTPDPPCWIDSFSRKRAWSNSWVDP